MLLDGLFTEDNKDVLEFTIFDLETTGLSPRTDEIVEVSFLRKKDNFIYTSLVYTDKEIPFKVSTINGITNNKLINAPTISHIVDNFNSNFRDTILVGHNCHSFDSRFLLKVSKSSFIDCLFLDTETLARMVVPGAVRHSMTSLCNLFGITITNQHTAEGDVLALSKLFPKLLSLFNESNKLDLTNLEKYSFIKKGNKLSNN